MRRLVPCLALLAVAACHKDHPDTDEEAVNFRPPVTMSRSDFGGTLDIRFDRLDHNHDGVIAGDELQTRRPGRLDRFDKDGNGKISRGEFVNASLAQFDARDLNHDGNVTADEQRLAERGVPDADNVATPGNAE